MADKGSYSEEKKKQVYDAINDLRRNEGISITAALKKYAESKDMKMSIVNYIYYYHKGKRKPKKKKGVRKLINKPASLKKVIKVATSGVQLAMEMMNTKPIHVVSVEFHDKQIIFNLGG